MIKLCMLALLILLVLCVVLFLRCEPGHGRILLLSIFSGIVVAEIVLYAVYREKSLYLDVALAFALLSFMDVQFYSVYLRRKGDL